MTAERHPTDVRPAPDPIDLRVPENSTGTWTLCGRRKLAWAH
jgi:hypothetical protein